jgi:hypothetical protein
MTLSWWVLTTFLLLWIAGVTALFLHIRENIRKAKERGWVSNGLGTTITAAENPASFRLIIYGWQFMGVVGLAFIAAGVVGLIIRIAQAL